jgi:hypothetical protein
MSLVNQPSRILISGDDAEWSSNPTAGGQSFNLTLPEAVVGAKGIDCARAVIPTTLYNIPDYQNKFYYTINGVVQSLTLTNNQYFSQISDLVTQLNADAVAQGDPLTFSYSNTTTRISVAVSGMTPFAHMVVDATNSSFSVGGYAGFTSVPLVTGVYTPSAFATMFASALQTAIQAVAGFGTATVTGTFVAGKVTLDFTNIAGFLGTFNNQTSAVKTLTGWTTTAPTLITSLTPLPYSFPTVAFVFPPDTASITPRASWPTRFALNTRLGFPNAGLTGAYTYAGTFLPNILRSRVFYLLCNATVDDSITTDGLRNVIAKIPCTSGYGGITVYQQNDYNWCKIVQSSYQNIELSVLDENYQPYQLKAEEPIEVELVFAYGDINNGY